VRRIAREVSVLTVRNLVHIRHEPLQLSDVTVQPVLFTLLFTYIFGAGVVLPHHGSYNAFAIAGLLALNLTTSAMGTSVGLSTDLASGAIDRFRTLPIWRPAVLFARSLADLLTSVLCATIVAVTGLLIGWRAEAGVARMLGGFCLFLFFSYAVSWGLRVHRSREQGAGVSAGDWAARALSARVRLQRDGPNPAHALCPPLHRRLEPGQRGDERSAAAVGQSEPVGGDHRLADAASGRSVADLVVRDSSRLRASRCAALPAAHDGVVTDRAAHAQVSSRR
jgi:ABC-2 type transporter